MLTNKTISKKKYFFISVNFALPVPSVRMFVNKKKAWGLLNIIVFEALDCPPIVTNNSPRRTVYSIPRVGYIYNTSVSTLLIIHNGLKLSRFQIKDKRKTLFSNMSLNRLPVEQYKSNEKH